MPGTILDLRKQAESTIGLRESPTHSNCTPIIKEFGYPVCAAWCAMWSWCMCHRTGVDFPKSASVGAVMQAAQAGKNKCLWIPRNGIIRPGDFSLFDFGGRGDWGDFHISWVNDANDQVNYQTIGGNENDAVVKRWRNRLYNLGFVRPTYGVPANDEESEMQVWTEDEKNYVKSAIGQVAARTGNLEAAFGPLQESVDVMRDFLLDPQGEDQINGHDMLIETHNHSKNAAIGVGELLKQSGS